MMLTKPREQPDVSPCMIQVIVILQQGSLSSLSFTDIYGLSTTTPPDPAMLDLHRRVDKILNNAQVGFWNVQGGAKRGLKWQHILVLFSSKVGA